MSYRACKDQDLLAKIKTLVQSERDLLIEILHLLREIDRRRLYCDLGFESLFAYAVQELRYSEGQASRRIQAMRLIKEIPEVEAKIASGELSLTNVQQAQSVFRDLQQANPQRVVSSEEKREILALVENKSTREAQRELIKLHPAAAMPKEKERIISDDALEVRFIVSDSLKAKLESVRSLLGPKGATMNYAELFEAMADVSAVALTAKRFGKKRTEAASSTPTKDSATVATEAMSQTEVCAEEALLASTEVKKSASQHQRYIPKEAAFYVWQRDKGACTNCGNKRNLNYDHVRPIACGGESTIDNLRLLCFACNQRASIKFSGKVYEKMRPTT